MWEGRRVFPHVCLTLKISTHSKMTKSNVGSSEPILIFPYLNNDND